MAFTPVSITGKQRKFTDEPKFGEVVDNKDPLMLGRVKVTIPGIYEGTVQSLPWVRRKTDTAFCGVDCEIFDVPEIGSIVEVKWPYDENTPVYSGAPYSQRHSTSAFTENYPYEAGIKFGEFLIKLDKGSNLLTIENGKVQVVLDSFGGCHVACDTVDIEAESNATIKSSLITLDGDVDVTGSLTIAEGYDGAIMPNSVAVVSGGLVVSVAP